jgi:hypothetical protein
MYKSMAILENALPRVYITAGGIYTRTWWHLVNIIGANNLEENLQAQKTRATQQNVFTSYALSSKEHHRYHL